ncbi:hypothetical protein [Paenibacillus sp. BC26]|uniref:hypothetical protein n=1 Tax=Paenibacillus sp. BC26 TaxID=1881032 RepID=UPI0015A6B2B1|nr:hypothetical protein [Paenibacillus sp. BC26]
MGRLVPICGNMWTLNHKGGLGIRFIIFLLLCCPISGCSGVKQTDVRTNSMFYDFTEPSKFPFEVNEIHTEIEIDNLRQFVFHYKNKQTVQELRYILSKVIIGEPDTLSDSEEMQSIQLENGILAYYNEDEDSQSIWWESENGFIARFVYYINANGHLEPLGENKLTQNELINLVNQVE